MATFESLKTLTDVFENLTNKIGLIKDSEVAHMQWLLACAILEKSRTAILLINSNWHGGLIEIIRSQMEASADLMLFLKDPEHYKVLQARQNATVLGVINRAKGTKRSLLSVSRALKDKASGPTLDAAYKLAQKNKNEPAEKSYIDSISRSRLGEDNYRYLCSFAHHNLTTLRIRFKPPNSEDGGVGKVSEMLLRLLIDQAVKNMAGPLMVITEKAKAASSSNQNL